MSFSDIPPESIELSSMEVGESSTELDLSRIPEEYHDLAEIFTEREAEKLPPHRPYDHTIPLEPGSTPPFGTIYSMSPKSSDGCPCGKIPMHDPSPSRFKPPRPGSDTRNCPIHRDPGRVRTQVILNVIGFGHAMSPTREMSCGFRDEVGLPGICV